MAAARDQDGDVDDRDRRAASEPLDCHKVAPGIIDVYHRGEPYRVDLRNGVCECPDSRYRDETCKHLRRIEMAIGERAIPDGVRADPTLRMRREGR